MGGKSSAANAETLPGPAPQPAKRAKLASQTTFSKAFDNFVGDNPNDVEGLLAYALYKRTIRDRCRNGATATQVIERDPPESEVQTYRNSAKTMIEDVMQIYEAEASPVWQQSYFEQRLGEWKGEIKNTIRSRTSVGGQIFVNLIAWAITIVLSLVIYYAVTAQDVDDIVRQKVDQAVIDAGSAGEKPNPDNRQTTR